MNYSFYELLALFFLYSFLGWCTEVAFAAVRHGKFVNRGFLNGPVCPIYGFGVVGAAVALAPLTGRPLALFLASALLCSVIELVTGWALEKIFHAKWWDYSGMKFNLGGYVCLEFSILWGLGAVFVLKIIHPAACSLVRRIPPVALAVTGLILLAVILLDLAATAAAVRRLQKRLALLTKLAGEIHGISDKLGGTIYDRVSGVMDAAGETMDRYDDYFDLYRRNRAEEKAMAEAHRAEESELLTKLRAEGRQVRELRRSERRTELESRREAFLAGLTEKNPIHNRLLKAFPQLRWEAYAGALEKLREVQRRLGRK